MAATPEQARAAYAAERARQLEQQRRRPPADPQTKLSAPPLPARRQTLCSCGDDGPCTCATHLAGAWPPPEQYERDRALAFRRRHGGET